MTHRCKKNSAAIGALSPGLHHVTQENGTERLFAGEYLDDHEPGIYVNVASDEPLFASADKFESATGWPNFTKPIDANNVAQTPDRSHAMARSEVRSS